jgi:hypothetical protein
MKRPLPPLLPTASLRSRLARIEGLLTLPEPELQDEEGICEEEWLAHYRLYGQKGAFKNEPDFPQALREFEEAIAQAKRDPANLPPPDFMPHAQEVRRRRYWREGSMPREIQQSLLWLTGMHCRVSEGIPAVTLQEWEMLKTWYEQHREEIAEWTVQAVGKGMTQQGLTRAFSNSILRIQL